MFIFSHLASSPSVFPYRYARSLSQLFANVDPDGKHIDTSLSFTPKLSPFSLWILSPFGPSDIVIDGMSSSSIFKLCQ